jgi:nucleotide-binding universal stress UspA family protein
MEGLSRNRRWVVKVLATFDGSPSSESIIEQLQKMAKLPIDEVLLFSVVDLPEKGVRLRGPLRLAVGVAAPGTTPIVLDAEDSGFVEDKGQAIDRHLAEREDYLKGIVGRLPAGPNYAVKAVIDRDPAGAIVKQAMSDRPDVIVMATHGHTGLIHILFGDVAEEVVRSGVAPVLLVHPESVRVAREAARADSPGAQ